MEQSYLVALTHMKLYEEISTKIFSIYMRYISAEDIHVYSIDDCFMDVTGYLETYHMTAYELAMTMIREVLYETGFTATAGKIYKGKVTEDRYHQAIPQLFHGTGNIDHWTMQDGTTIERNEQIGGHRAGKEDDW